MTEIIVKKQRGQSAEHMAKIRAMRKAKSTLAETQNVTYEVSKTMPGAGALDGLRPPSNGAQCVVPDVVTPLPTIVKLPNLPMKYLSVQRLGGLYTLATLTVQDDKIIAQTFSEPDIKPIVLEAFKIAAAKEFFIEHSVQTGAAVHG